MQSELNEKLISIVGDICSEEGAENSIIYLADALTGMLVFLYTRTQPLSFEDFRNRIKTLFDGLQDATEKKYKIAMEKEL